MSSYTLYHGDCLDVLPTLGPVASIVTDPPAGISFMGAEWDGDRGGRDQWIAWLGARLRVAAALLPPGGAALVWALPRTSHWTALTEGFGFVGVEYSAEYLEIARARIAHAAGPLFAEEAA